MRGFNALWFKIAVSTLAVKILAKATASFCTHGCTMDLWVVFSIELE